MTEQKKLKVINVLRPHKSFFVTLASSKSLHNTQTVLASASSAEIKAILILIHNCTLGIIPVPSSLVTQLLRSKRLGAVRQRFELPQTFEKLLKDERKEKLRVLLSLKSLLPAFCRIII